MNATTALRTEMLQSLGESSSKPIANVAGVLGFFKTGGSMYVSVDFVALMKEHPLVPCGVMKYSRHKIVSRANVRDSDVVDGSNSNIAFKAAEFFGFLAALIESQLSGVEAGDLAYAGQSNDFYICSPGEHVYVVNVLFVEEYHQWHINLREFDEWNLYPGTIIFLPE